MQIKKGKVLIYRLFDVAEEINVTKVTSLLRDSRGPDRFQVPTYIDRAIVMKQPPISFGLGREVIKVKNREIKLDVTVKVRDFGTVSLIYEITLEPGTSWTELLNLAVDLEEGQEIDQLAKQQVKEVMIAIGAACKKPTQWSAFEDYIIYFFEELEGLPSVKHLLETVDVAALLTSENKVTLSAASRKSATENYYQYGENDLTLIEWNSALVVEPGGGREVLDILEFALTHLMEMRYYDDLLDIRLNSLYEDIEKRRNSIWSSNFSSTRNEASTRFIEFSELIERVENSLKVVGDFYLATLYRAATKRFRLSDWQQSTTRKMDLLAQVTTLLQGEINSRRSLWLEVIVILLIAYEVGISIFRH
jgi:hypothetical protein